MEKDLLESIQAGTLRYSYRGIPTIKDPFSLAIYPLLIWEHRPRTIFEIGANKGGSALWLSDMLGNFGINGRVHSVDQAAVERSLENDRLRFFRGDAKNLGAIFSENFLGALPRPWLVIEDASHFPECTMAVLRFFEHRMASGEYIIVEDGNVPELYGNFYQGGPKAAIHEFLARATSYSIDRTYTDWFGPNVTWHTDGYLRKTVS